MPYHCSVVLYNLEEYSRVVLCRFESMAILVHGNVAVITETRVCGL